MLTTVRFVRDAYAPARRRCPTEEALEREPRRPSSCTWCRPTRSPTSRARVRALRRLALSARAAPRGRRHQGGGGARAAPGHGREHGRARAPLPRDAAALSAEAPRASGHAGPRAQGASAQLGAPPRGARARSWARTVDPARVFVGRERRRLHPRSGHLPLDRPARARRAGGLAYQGITLSLANYDRLDIRGKICAIQQSSIFIRVSIARLINEVKRVRLFGALRARASRASGAWLRPAFELLLPPLADLPRPQPVRAPGHARRRSAASRPRAPPRTRPWATRWARAAS